MLKFNQARKYVADFETTVYTGQQNTEVWAGASVACWSEDVSIFNCIDDFLNFHFRKPENQIIYFHNLKFDGQFILDFLLKNGFKISGTEVTINDPVDAFEYEKQYKKMQDKSIYPLISDIGQWYMVVVKVNNHIIEFRDSLKLLPFSVDIIGKGFNTKHRKLSIEYTGERHAHGFISDAEKEYIKNDVLVVKEALEQLFAEKHTELTIGSCCIKEFKSICRNTTDTSNPLALDTVQYKDVFPDLFDVKIDYDLYGSENADEYIRKSYRGGWCYVVKGIENKVINNHGCTADVNSLYPSRMHSESGCVYPFGYPTFFKSDIPEKIKDNNKYYYFVRFKCRFKIKDGYLPFIQIKNSFLYQHNEYLETSDYFVDGKYYRYLNKNGEKVDSIHEYTMCCTDFKLLFKHYDIFDFEILDGCYFRAYCGFFDSYINKYAEIKQKNKGAKRTIAKLFLNNLYGKFATSKNSSYQVPIMVDNIVKYFTVPEQDKKSGYIAVGSAITSYARGFTITHAQDNFHGADKPGFKYADTDSIHCDCLPDDLQNINVHPTNFNCWKIENEWNQAIFVRQKTYIEHTIKEDFEDVKPYYLIKCAGMNQKCKDLLNASLTQDYSKLDLKSLSETQKEFIHTKRTLSDFKEGLEIEGKLLPKKIDGGLVLTETTFKMR